MDENINLLIKQRGVLKAKLTRFEKFILPFNSILRENIENTKIVEIETRLNHIMNTFEEYNDIQKNIELALDNIDEQLSERELFENQYYNLSSIAKNILQPKLSDKTNYDGSEDGSVAHSSHYSINSKQSLHQLALSKTLSPKLPPIPIPKFSGGYENWMEFKDTFKSLIHDNNNLSEVEKLHFLKSSLEGPAKEILRNIKTMSGNYNIAWDLIAERFKNKKIIINTYLKSLCDLPNMNKENSYGIRILLDGLTTTLRSLENMQISTNSWDIIIIFLIHNKVDEITYKEWQKIKHLNELPTLEEFKEFLKLKAESLESIEASNSKENKFNINKNINNKPLKSFIVNSSTCPNCSKDHNLTNCDEFLNLPSYNRYETVKKLRLCTNCLKPNHLNKDCTSGTCRKCSFKHHTLLHFKRENKVQTLISTNADNNLSEKPNINENVNLSKVVLSSNIVENNDILLSTALVKLIGKDGSTHICRALLDCGSQSNFITEDLCETLKIDKKDANISIVGINQSRSCIQYRCNITFNSLINNFGKTISCLIIPKISDSIPNKCINQLKNIIPNHLKLADPSFINPGPVQLLIGVDTFYDLLCIGQVKLGINLPTMQKTRLGWILAGTFSLNQTNQINENVRYCNFNQNIELLNQLEKFWKLEESPNTLKPLLTAEDKECEAIFIRTTKRDELGRFIVQIPLKLPVSKLGSSENAARRQFLSLEKKLHKNPKLLEQYTSFMDEYKELGHMSLETENSSEISYFLPHHCVVDETRSTTKLRVVFNGSYPTDSGISFNDLQYVGPNLQDDAISILLKFRIPNIVVCADIEKMYRMILVEKEQRCLQKIFWRDNPEKKLDIYHLNTVTYGTASAAFLSIRCLKQLGFDFEEKYPEACEIILHNFFVDDLLFGTENLDDALNLSIQISNILKSAQLNLRKWLSNSSELLDKLGSKNYSTQPVLLGNKTESKTLGLHWSFIEDTLKYHLNSINNNTKQTKRLMLSAIAHIYDPLGLLSPCIILVKILLQKLWSEKIGWDDSLPLNIFSSWQKIYQNLNSLNNLSIERQMICKNAINIELHGFCDSSIEAYGACIYLKSFMNDGNIQISLIMAKSKVSPLKVVTLPRLELCGALVLSKLIYSFKNFVKLNISQTFLWTDSTVVLGWLQREPKSLSTFVGNRISKIQNLTDTNDWNHISSKDNPADILSRGCFPQNLATCKLWWQGPEWLKLESKYWPESIQLINPELPEIKSKIHLNKINHPKIIWEKFSNINRLKRSFAYSLRFIENCKIKDKNQRKIDFLNNNEIKKSFSLLLKFSQEESFSSEIEEIKKGNLKLKGILSTLNVFLDSENILRVGGRLEFADITYEQKHPAILSSKHRFTQLLFKSEHKRLLHAGPQQVLSSLRERFWPIGGRNLAKKISRNCVICFKAKPQTTNQIMGVLPKERVIQSPPFHTTGVDYAGPFLIKNKNGRGAKLSKCYICLFVCFSTRAVHIELVSDLTSESFISTFNRFIARRGKPNTIFSDNGSNFIGANSSLIELSKFLKKQNFSEFENQGINWKFIPSRSPNFGGIWEAGIKCCKNHLKKVLGNISLTFEDFTTLLTQIEAILNSRPLFPLSSDKNDLDTLTPAHFLIGRTLTSLPEENLENIFINRLTKFQHIQKIKQDFWKRWSKEYLSLLQQRFKWKYPMKNVEMDDIVIIKEDNLPCLNWKIGRVIKIIKGVDDLCRVVEVKTAHGVYKRSISKICILPSNNSEDIY